MSWYDTMQKRANISGGNLRNETILMSKYAHQQTSVDDPSFRSVKRYLGHDFLDEFPSNVIDDTSQNKKTGLKKVICDIGQEINIGNYIVYANESNSMEHWIVTYVEDNDITKTATMAQCNYNLKWMDVKTLRVVEYPVVLLDKNSYSSGVWSNTFAQYVDGEIACAIPLLSDTKQIKRDDRFLISNNEINPDSFRVSKLQNSMTKGLMKFNFEEDEPSPVFDDYENMIANRWRFENSYEIIVLNGESFNVGFNQNAQMQVRVEAHNTLMNTTSIVSSPTLLFKPINENILKIHNDGTIQPTSIGSTFVDVLLMSNTSETATVITQKRIEITVINETVVENIVKINGSSTIFFDAKSKYTATLFKNGLEISDTFEFKLLNDTSLPLNTKIAKLVNVQATTCEIQAFDVSTNITLSTKSTSTNVEQTKVITIRDIL